MHRRPIVRALTVLAVAALAASAAPRPGLGCSCTWAGPFLTVAPRAPLIVRARVLAHHGEGAGTPLAMDLEVLEVLHGESPTGRLRVWGDDGALCRPYVTTFPVGSEWVLALDGPGSKPGMTPDHAISACGSTWLEVRDGARVRGNLDDRTRMDVVQEVSLAELRARLGEALAADRAPAR